MARGDGLYDLCAVTDQNWQPAVPGGGSAIFVHLWRRPRWPTAGCVAFRRSDLSWILARWTARSRIVIRARGGL
jgi:L,D-peptidoglycan transpeptidase YkuD (ErfK/YbiS/YcfS/YnhG family)